MENVCRQLLVCLIGFFQIQYEKEMKNTQKPKYSPHPYVPRLSGGVSYKQFISYLTP